MNFQIRSGTASDGTAILALMPRLASFDLPASRNPVDLWQSDAAMLESWMNGEAEQCMVQVAVDDSGTVTPIIDALALLEWGFTSGAAPPAPGPTGCATDPTDDDVSCEVSTVCP